MESTELRTNGLTVLLTTGMNTQLVVSTLTSFYLEYEYLDGRSQIKVHTGKLPGHRLTAPSVPWRSPIQVLTGVDVA